MLAGQEFATCSEDDFRAYIIGWTLVWSGIIPYTILAAKVRTSDRTMYLVVQEVARSHRCSGASRALRHPCGRYKA